MLDWPPCSWIFFGSYPLPILYTLLLGAKMYEEAEDYFKIFRLRLDGHVPCCSFLY